MVFVLESCEITCVMSQTGTYLSMCTSHAILESEISWLRPSWEHFPSKVRVLPKCVPYPDLVSCFRRFDNASSVSERYNCWIRPSNSWFNSITYRWESCDAAHDNITGRAPSNQVAFSFFVDRPENYHRRHGQYLVLELLKSISHP